MKRTNATFIKRYQSFHQGVKKVKSDKREKDVWRWEVFEGNEFYTIFEPKFMDLLSHLNNIFCVLLYCKRMLVNNRCLDPMEEEEEFSFFWKHREPTYANSKYHFTIHFSLFSISLSFSLSLICWIPTQLEIRLLLAD